jgi:hypothetical protein
VRKLGFNPHPTSPNRAVDIFLALLAATAVTATAPTPIAVTFPFVCNLASGFLLSAPFHSLVSLALICLSFFPPRFRHLNLSFLTPSSIISLYWFLSFSLDRLSLFLSSFLRLLSFFVSYLPPASIFFLRFFSSLDCLSLLFPPSFLD